MKYLGCGERIGKTGSLAPAAISRTFLVYALFGFFLFFLTPVVAEAESSLPLTITSNGNAYVIKEVTCGTDDKGNTTVIISGSGYEILPFRVDHIVLPIWSSFSSGGEDYSWENASTNPTSITFAFSTAKKPETIRIFPEDNRDQIYEFTCK